MKIVLGLLGCLCLPLGAVLAEEPQTSPHNQLASMGWLAGTWEGPMWGGTFLAHYSTPEGGKVISYNKLLKEGRIAFHEFEVFEVDDGRVLFHPYPGGKKAISLTLSECDPAKKRVVFENPEKDFPTRVEYHRSSDGRLIVTLTDPHHDSDKLERFELTRKTDG